MSLFSFTWLMFSWVIACQEARKCWAVGSPSSISLSACFTVTCTILSLQSPRETPQGCRWVGAEQWIDEDGVLCLQSLLQIFLARTPEPRINKDLRSSLYLLQKLRQYCSRHMEGLDLFRMDASKPPRYFSHTIQSSMYMGACLHLSYLKTSTNYSLFFFSCCKQKKWGAFAFQKPSKSCHCLQTRVNSWISSWCSSLCGSLWALVLWAIISLTFRLSSVSYQRHMVFSASSDFLYHPSISIYQPIYIYLPVCLYLSACLCSELTNASKIHETEELLQV